MLILNHNELVFTRCSLCLISGLLDQRAEDGEDVGFEPGVFVEPGGVSPTGVWEWEEVGEVLLVGGDGLSHGGFAFVAEVEFLGVLADEEGESQVFELLADFGMPERGAFGARWEVAPFDVGAGVAEAHGDQGEAFGIVEFFGGDIQPGAKAVTAGVRPGFIVDVGEASRGLADDHDFCVGMEIDRGTRRIGEVFSADGAGVDQVEEAFGHGIIVGRLMSLEKGGLKKETSDRVSALRTSQRRQELYF